MSFNCAWAPFSGDPSSLDWLPMSMTDIAENHIRYLDVTDKEGPTNLLSSLDSGSNTQAVILTNASDSFQTCETMSAEMWTIPVLVVGLSTGGSIKQFLIQNEKEVEVRVVLQPKETVELETQEVTQPSSQISTWQRVQGMYMHTWEIPESRNACSTFKKLHFQTICLGVGQQVLEHLLGKGSSPSQGMFSRVKQFLFPEDSSPVFATKNVGIFKLVMAEFYNYEQEVSVRHCNNL